MDESPNLRDATVQEIQLELIRRTQFNALDGQRVVDSLQRHRKLWEAALLDRPGLPDYENPGRLLMMGLIKLRDLSGNFWNADTLYILTPSPEDAISLKEITESEEWAGEAWTIDDRKEIESALGTGRCKKGLLIVWWD